MRKSTLANVAAGISASAIAGYGLSIGRDAWKATKKNTGGIFFFLLLLAILFLPFFGGRNLVRGYPRQSIFEKIWILISSIMLTVSGFAVAFGLSLMFISLFSTGADYGPSAAALVLGGGLVIVAFVIGVLVGFIQRSSRKRKFAIAEANQRFLDGLRFSETGEEEITHYDGDGNALRIIERAKDGMVFLAVGKRNRRAYIELDKDGMMTGYTGVIGINEPRIYSKVG